MSNQKTTVGVIYGGRSVEHDVSIVTGQQVMRALLTSPAYEVVPIYIDRSGKWVTGAPLMDLNNYQTNITDLMGVQEVALSPSVQHQGLIVNPGSGFLRKSRVQELMSSSRPYTALMARTERSRGLPSWRTFLTSAVGSWPVPSPTTRS
jgi:D-alanine-D-alanine ligase-like ATP-grasp enzyme